MSRKKQRHVRWNWEKSEDNTYEGNPIIRYHFVVVDDKWRDKKVCDIVDIITNIQSGLIPIRRKEGKVEGTKFRYLFVSYDSPVNPKLLNLDEDSDFFKDQELYERRSSRGIEEYVDTLYSK